MYVESSLSDQQLQDSVTSEQRGMKNTSHWDADDTDEDKSALPDTWTPEQWHLSTWDWTHSGPDLIPSSDLNVGTHLNGKSTFWLLRALE